MKPIGYIFIYQLHTNTLNVSMYAIRTEYRVCTKAYICIKCLFIGFIAPSYLSSYGPIAFVYIWTICRLVLFVCLVQTFGTIENLLALSLYFSCQCICVILWKYLNAIQHLTIVVDTKIHWCFYCASWYRYKISSTIPSL